MQGKVETRVGIFVLLALGVFVYMGFQIGAFRFDRARYTEYKVYFEDIAGLSRKADVKIAGVKIGWVEKVTLIPDGKMQARASLMVLKNYRLYSDAHALVRQDGLLGPHYIELIPGDPLLHTLEPGDALDKPSEAPVSIDELLRQFKKIAVNVEEVTESFRDTVGGTDGRDQLRSLFDNLSLTAEKVSSFSDILEKAFIRNEDNIDKLLAIGDNVEHLSTRLDVDVFPSFQEGVEKISNAFDRDFARIADKLESTAEALEQASVEARDGLRNVSSVAEKIDEGKGLLGKLVNEDETYQDLKVAVQGFKNYVTKLDRLQFVFDTHVETMQRPAENYRFEDAKGYFEMRIHPNEDHFYNIQFVASEKGFVRRKRVEREFTDLDGRLVDPRKLMITGNNQKLCLEPDDLLVKDKMKIKRNTIKLGLQFGKIYKNLAFRLGLFEGAAGLGVDFDIPFNNDKFRWVTTLEMFDTRGWNRRNDRRPHLKWLNKMFILDNIYFVFGADDFISRRNASAFFGAGIRFGDDNVKYLLGSLSGAGGAGGYIQ